MIRSYLPAIVFLVLGGAVGGLFTMLNSLFGRASIAKTRQAMNDPYECGLPSEVQQTFKFGVSFYLVAMMFILFDIEVLFLYPAALMLKEFGLHALIAISIFVGFLFIAFIYEWRRGALNWR